MQGLYQLNRLTKDRSVCLPAIPNQRFYRLWIVEDHIEWTTGPTDQPLNLAGTLWFFPKHYKPGIPPGEVQGFALWFDDHFLLHNPLLQDVGMAAPWRLRQPFVVSAAGAFEAICNLCRDHQAYLSGASADPVLAYTAVSLLLLHLRAAAQDQLPGMSCLKKYPAAVKFRELVEQHHRQQHLPSFYAGALNLTMDTLRRQCKESFAQTPTELIHQKLIEKAKDLLLEGELSIKEIARALGFEDESYFVRFFRQLAMLPPRAYRKAFSPRV